MTSATCECGCKIAYWGEKAPNFHKCFKCGNKVEFKSVEAAVEETEPESRPPLKKLGRPATKRKA